MAFSPDGQTLAACQASGFLQFWDVVTGKEQRTVQLHDPAHPNKDHVYCYQLHVSPDGQRVSTLERIRGREESTRLALWETATGKLVRQQLFPGGLRDVAWSADGSAVALPLKEGLTLVEVNTGTVRFCIPGQPAGGTPAASPDDRLLAARRTARPGESPAEAKGAASAVGVWEAATGKEITTVATGRVEHLALAPDNRSLVTTDERFLRVWDLATGKERRRWPLPEAVTDSWGRTFVFRLRLSPDGRRAFTALADGTALVWDLAPALRPAEPLVKDQGEREIAAWWADLAGEDAGRAHAVVWRLIEAPEQSVALLRKNLKLVGDEDIARARGLLRDLDNDTFSVRESASKELEKMGRVVIPFLRQALAAGPSPEVRRRLEALLDRASNSAPPPEVLRRLRAIQVLEQIGSKEAVQILKALAQGLPAARETQEAKASLERLDRRPAAP